MLIFFYVFESLSCKGQGMMEITKINEWKRELWDEEMASSFIIISTKYLSCKL